MMLFSGSGHLNQSKCSDSKAPLQQRENISFFFAIRVPLLLIRSSRIGPAPSCWCASAGLNWWYRDVRVWDSGRVLVLHYSQQLGLSLWPFLWLQQWPLWCRAITLWLDSEKKTHNMAGKCFQDTLQSWLHKQVLHVYECHSIQFVIKIQYWSLCQHKLEIWTHYSNDAKNQERQVNSALQ